MTCVLVTYIKKNKYLNIILDYQRQIINLGIDVYQGQTKVNVVTVVSYYIDVSGKLFIIADQKYCQAWQCK